MIGCAVITGEWPRQQRHIKRIGNVFFMMLDFVTTKPQNRCLKEELPPKQKPRNSGVSFKNQVLLPYQFQLVDDVFCTAKFIYAPKHIPDVHVDGTIQVFVKCNLVAERFVVAIESEAQ